MPDAQRVDGGRVVRWVRRGAGAHDPCFSPPDADTAYAPWPSVRDGFDAYQAAQRFRDRMRAVLELPGHDPALRDRNAAEIVRAFEESQLVDAPPPWRRGIANARMDRSALGLRLLPRIASSVPLEAPSRTVAVSDDSRWRTLLSDGRVLDFECYSDTGSPRPKVYADEEKIIVLEIGFDADPYAIVVYENDAMQDSLWVTTVETDEGERSHFGSGWYWSDAWLVIHYSTYYVFGLHAGGFYYHAFDAETGERRAGYAYDAPWHWHNPDTGQRELVYDGSEPAGRAFPPAKAYRGW